MQTEKKISLRKENEKELFFKRVKCKSLCHKYNGISPDMLGLRMEMIKNIIGKTKSIYLIEQPFMCDYGYNISVGENFYANHNMLILDSASVSFGDNVLIGPNCSFYTSMHPTNKILREKGIDYASPITVGNNVWICGNVTVLPGVHIGDNSVIGAGSIVNKDIPANVIAAGNPCDIIKRV